MAINLNVKEADVNDAKSEMYKFIDSRVKDIVFNRRVAEMLMDEPNEKYDARLNEMCDKWHKVFTDMSRAELMKYMIEDLLETISGGE